MSSVRVGTGYDSHRFSASRRLVLGGIEIPGSPGLAGHSDGDAVLHAIIDALLGAAGLGSIGLHFPDDSAEFAGADSAVLLGRTSSLLQSAGFHVVNIDATVIAERPRIQPHAARMAERIAGLLEVEPGVVSIKGKSNEGMGWIGRGEGIAVMAVASIDRSVTE